MPKTITREVYQFNELSEDAKKKAIEEFSDLNVDYEWWEYVYEDAEENFGVKITGFNLGRGRSIDIELKESGFDICENVLKTCGETCDIYKACEAVLNKYKVLRVTEELTDNEDEDTQEEKRQELEEEVKGLLENYFLKTLQEEYDYLLSDEAIIESIEANEYEFNEDGTSYC